MRFIDTPLADLAVVEPEPVEDARGFFARTYCSEAFRERGMQRYFPQCNTSFNLRKGTIRGLHFQKTPHEEAKLVRCVRGSIFDVAVDLRRHSPTFLRWFGVELNQDNRRALYVPRGFAHGFQTLSDASEVLYMMGEKYRAEAAAGVRWNDPVFDIRWPVEAAVLSPKDQSYADFSP